MLSKERIKQNLKLGLRDCKDYKTIVITSILALSITGYFVGVVALSVRQEIKNNEYVNGYTDNFYYVAQSQDYMTREQTEEVINFIYDSGYSSTKIETRHDGMLLPMYLVLGNESYESDSEFGTLYLNSGDIAYYEQLGLDYEIEEVSEDMKLIIDYWIIEEVSIPIQFVSKEDFYEHINFEQIDGTERLHYKSQLVIETLVNNFKIDADVSVDTFKQIFEGTCVYVDTHEDTKLSQLRMQFINSYHLTNILPVLFIVFISMMILYKAMRCKILKEYGMNPVSRSQMKDMYVRIGSLIFVVTCMSGVLALLLITPMALASLVYSETLLYIGIYTLLITIILIIGLFMNAYSWGYLKNMFNKK